VRRKALKGTPEILNDWFSFLRVSFKHICNLPNFPEASLKP